MAAPLICSAALGSSVSAAVPALSTRKPLPGGTVAMAGKLKLAADAPDQTTRLPRSARVAVMLPVPVSSPREAGSRKGKTSAVPAGSETSALELDEASTVARVRLPGDPPSKSPRPTSQKVVPWTT